MFQLHEDRPQVPDTGEPIVNVAKLRSARPKSQGLSRAARMRIKQRPEIWWDGTQELEVTG